MNLKMLLRCSSSVPRLKSVYIVIWTVSLVSDGFLFQHDVRGKKQDSLCLKYLHSDEHLEIAMFSDETIIDKHAI